MEKLFKTSEIEEKCINMMKLLRWIYCNLRKLEDKLLNALKNVQGSILENDAVISTLE